MWVPRVMRRWHGPPWHLAPFHVTDRRGCDAMSLHTCHSSHLAMSFWLQLYNALSMWTLYTCRLLLGTRVNYCSCFVVVKDFWGLCHGPRGSRLGYCLPYTCMINDYCVTHFQLQSSHMSVPVFGQPCNESLFSICSVVLQSLICLCWLFQCVVMLGYVSTCLHLTLIFAQSFRRPHLKMTIIPLLQSFSSTTGRNSDAVNTCHLALSLRSYFVPPKTTTLQQGVHPSIWHKYCSHWWLCSQRVITFIICAKLWQRPNVTLPHRSGWTYTTSLQTVGTTYGDTMNCEWQSCREGMNYMNFIVLTQTKYMGMFKWTWTVRFVNDLCLLPVYDVVSLMQLSNSAHSTTCILQPHPLPPIGPRPHVDMEDALHPNAPCWHPICSKIRGWS